MNRRRPAIDWENQTLRSLLFAPGNHARRLEKVGQFGSDAIVLDLEDAVANAEKIAARASTRAALPTYDDTVVIVRINGVHTGLAESDVEAVVCPDLDCLMVPKVETPDTLTALDELVTQLERERGIPEGTIRMLPLVETALGIVRCEEIAFAVPPRVVTLVFGLGDFSVDIGVDLTREATELLYARSRVVVAARAAGLPAPLDGPYPDIHDLEGLYENTLLSRRLGFQGRVVVYPAQVDPVQRAYSELSPEEVEHARRVVEAFEEAETSGLASIQVEGRFVDYPLYFRARHRLRLHEAHTARSAR
ncbi:MAG TPA: CoA ester lyase [Gaiellaceae bacterium]|nr:CoA ester lyase [Gaiellaceae bacterium]